MNLAELAHAMAESGRGVELNANQMKIGVAMQINALVVLQTPVDSGRARSNWQVGIDASPSDELDTADTDGGSTVGKNDSAMREAQPGQAIYLTNNVAYIERLNAGWSAQAPSGYIEVCVETAISKADQWKIV